MSRISRYQDSMNKFIKNKSCIINLNEDNKKNVYNTMKNADNLISIIFLTILGSQSKKNGNNYHGYYMACGIEMMAQIIKIIDNRNYYEKELKLNDIDYLINRLIILVNISFTQNIEYLQNIIKKDLTNKYFCNMNKLLNNNILQILNYPNISYDDNIKKTDLLKFTFDKIKSPKTLITHINKANKKDLITYIENKYGSLCQSALIISWTFGGGDEKEINNLSSLGLYLGNILKISYDFENLERDLQTADKHSNNYVINYGIQDAFEYFVENKIKFIEGCMTLDIYTNTIKEILDIIEDKIDTFIDNTVPDLKSYYTISSNS